MSPRLAQSDALTGDGGLLDASGGAAAALSLPELGLLAGMVVAGVALLVLGRRLVKPVCVASGVVLGIAAAGLAVSLWSELGSYRLAAVAVGAVLGGVVSGLLFRVWVAFAGAVLLALVVPLGSLAWQGTPLPLEETGGPAAAEADAAAASLDGGPGHDASQLASPLVGDVLDDAGIDTEEAERTIREGVERGVDKAREAAGEVGSAVLESLESVLDRHRSSVEAWWEELGETGRQSVVIGGAVGGVLGLLLGVALPYTAASLLSALAGALLVVFAGRTLAVATGSETLSGLVPTGPRALVAVTGLITLAGVALQWTLRPRKSD